MQQSVVHGIDFYLSQLFVFKRTVMSKCRTYKPEVQQAVCLQTSIQNKYFFENPQFTEYRFLPFTTIHVYIYPINNIRNFMQV